MPPVEPTLPAYISFPEYELTRGPAVVEICELAGFVPDQYQRMCLDILFAVNDDDKVAAYEFAILAPRQNIKSSLFEMAVLGWLFVTRERLIVWSAHLADTSAGAHRHLCQLIKACPALDALVAHYYYGNGDWAIETKDGRRAEFKTRTKDGGRGLSGDKVILDEAFGVTRTHLGGLMPTLRARPDPQLIYGSSAPKADAEVLHKLQARGRAGVSKRMAYIEYSAPEQSCELPTCDHEFGRPGCQLDNRANWYKANTALGVRIAEESMQAEREALSPDEFARELLGWPEAPPTSIVEPLFGADKWEDCAVEPAEHQIVDARCFGVAVTLDRKHAAVSVAGLTAEKRLHVEVVEHRPGTAWLPARTKELQARWGSAVVIDGKGPASSLEQAFADAGVTLHVAATADVCDAFDLMFDRVQIGNVQHMSNPELDGAVAGAVPRAIGDRKALGRKTSAFDISPLEAAELAAWGSVNNIAGDYDVMNSFF